MRSKARHLRRTSRQYPSLPTAAGRRFFRFFSLDPHAHTNILNPHAAVVVLLSRFWLCPFPDDSTRPSLGCRFTSGPLHPWPSLSLSLSSPNGLPPRAKHTTQCDCVYSLSTMVNTDNMVQHGADAIEIGLSGPGAMGVGVTKTQGSCVSMLHLHC